MNSNDLLRAGAGGNWPRESEHLDENVVQQINDASCVAAAAEMLCREHGMVISQSEILSAIGEFANSVILISYLNQRSHSGSWLGGFADGTENENAIRNLVASEPAFLGILREGMPVGHAVLVRASDSPGYVRIHDPFDQTSYNMTFENFIQVVSEVVYKR